MRKILEIKIATAKEDLEAFRKASRGLNQSMTYNMSNAIKKVVKSHKGVAKVTKSFLDLLDNIGSFSKDKIPLSVLRRMYAKRYIGGSSYPGATLSGFGTVKDSKGTFSLKRSDPEKYSQLKVAPYHQLTYMDGLQKKAREKEMKKDEVAIEPIKKVATRLESIAKILEAFVIKVNFHLKKLIFVVVDERGKVGTCH